MPKRMRMTRSSKAMVAALVAIMTVLTIWQVRSRDPDMLAGARRQDLVTMLDQLTQESRRLESEIAHLRTTKRDLTSSADSESVARAEAERRITSLGIVAGTVPARGPGVSIVIRDPKKAVDAAMIVDCMEELRDAGAEVIEVNDTHRIVASTWFSDSAAGVTVNGTTLRLPLVIEAIGDPQALDEGVQFRGGIASQIRAVGGEVIITRVQDLDVASVVPAPQYKAAKPQR